MDYTQIEGKQRFETAYLHERAQWSRERTHPSCKRCSAPLPYSWAYGSKTYIFQSVATTVVATLSGLLFINAAFTVKPLSIAVVKASV